MTTALSRMRVVALALTPVIGALLLGWAVAADSETAAPVLPAHTAAAPVPSMRSRTFASNFEAIAERPLFSQTRKPTPPKPQSPAIQTQQEAPPAALAATLVGVVVSPNVRSAVVRLASGKSVAVAEGESVEGWQLKQVTPDIARFQNKGATTDLSFPVHQASAARAMPSAALSALVRRRR